MSLGTPINWGAPTASPSAQPEAFRYGGEGYVRMPDGKVLQTSQYLSQQSALNTQSWIDSAARYDPDEPLRQAARAMEAQPYRSPTTGAPVSREAFFREQSRLSYQASNQYDSAMRARLANAPTAWDTPLPRGVTVEMIPTGPGSSAFAPAPTAGAIVPARQGAPVGEALRTPVNAGVRPRIPALANSPATSNAVAAGVLSGAFGAYGAYSGGAGFFEGAGAGVGGLVGGGLGGLGGAALGASAGAGAGTFALPVVGTVSGGAVGGYVGGGLGAAAGGSFGGGLGRGLGRAIDNLIPDFLDPPNALDPEAMNPGALLSPGSPPPFTGGQDASQRYRVTYQYNSIGTAGQIIEPPNQQTAGGGVGYLGPIRGIEVRGGSGFTQMMLLYGDGEEQIRFSSAIQGDYANTKIVSVARVDGQPDTSGNPPGGSPPVRAQNPARQTSTPSKPRTLPPPTPAPVETDLPWPQTPARETPDTTPLSPPAPAPNLTETPTSEAPTSEAPTTSDEPTDLNNPNQTPPDLSKPGKTPPVADLAKNLGGSSPGGLSTPDVLEVVIPIILLEGLRQQANTPTGNLIDRTAPNPNVQRVTPPPVQTATKPNPPTCIYEQQRVMDIQNKATDTQQRSANPVSGFPGLYGLQIESRNKLGQTFDLLGKVDAFATQAWKTTRMQKILDVMTFVGVMHNVSMLSRDVGETFLELVGQGLQAAGIRDEENKVIDVQEVFSENVEGLLINTLGVERYRGLSAAWNKANRIVSSASSVIWTVRSIADASQDLSEWTAENTGRIGNALKRWGVVGENAYPTMSESAKAQHRMRSRFDKLTGGIENVEDRLSTYTQATSSVIEIQEETSELTQNFAEFKKSVEEGIPDPWLDNAPIKTADDQAKADSTSPPIDVSDSQKG